MSGDQIEITIEIGGDAPPEPTAFKFISWRRGLKGAYAQITPEDPRVLIEHKSREHTYIETFPIEPRHAYLTLDELEGFYKCPPYKMASEE